MHGSLRHLLTLLIAISLIMVPLGGVLAMADMAEHGPGTVHCPQEGTIADGLHADLADPSRADNACCDLPCLMKCGHGAMALPAPALMPAFTGTTPTPYTGLALTVLYLPPAGHPPRVN